MATGSSDSRRLTPTEGSVAGHPGAQLDAVVARAFDEPDARYPRRTRAIVVMQGGRIIAERYATSIGFDTALAGWSMSKSVVNALVGILVPAPIPEWHQPGDPRAGITLDQLLRMSSGLRFDESLVIVGLGRTRYPHTWDHAAFVRGVLASVDRGTPWASYE